MARRKELKIKLKELEQYEAIVKLIKDDPRFENFDLSTIEIKAQGKITPIINNPESAIKNLERYLHINHDLIRGVTCADGKTELKYVTKTQLSKMLGITRATLNKWLDDGFIHESYIGFGEIPHNVNLVKVLDPYLILDYLKEYVKEQKEKNKEK